MGNSQFTADQAASAFFWSFSTIFVIGLLTALRAWMLLHRRFFDCTRQNSTLERYFGSGGDLGREGGGGKKKNKKPRRSFYESLRKPPYWPGTIAYVIFYFLVYFFQAYTMWRVYINVPAFNDMRGAAFWWLSFLWVIANGLGSEFLFGLKDLTWSLLMYLLAFILSGIALIMLGLITWLPGHIHMPSVAVFILQCIPTAGTIIVLVLLCILRAMNQSPYSWRGYRAPVDLDATPQELKDAAEYREDGEEEQDGEEVDTVNTAMATQFLGAVDD